MPARLTQHQQRILNVLTRRSTIADRWVYGKDIGALMALKHLTEKGYAEEAVNFGPRGGEHLYYRPTAQGRAKAR